MTAKLRGLSPAGDRQLSHNPANAITPDRRARPHRVACPPQTGPLLECDRRLAVEPETAADPYWGHRHRRCHIATRELSHCQDLRPGPVVKQRGILSESHLGIDHGFERFEGDRDPTERVFREVPAFGQGDDRLTDIAQFFTRQAIEVGPVVILHARYRAHRLDQIIELLRGVDAENAPALLPASVSLDPILHRHGDRPALDGPIARLGTDQPPKDPGVAPIPSARSAHWMRTRLFGTIIPDSIVERLDKAGDPRREGVRICVEILRELATIPGVAGAHIMAPQNPSAIAEVLAAFDTAAPL